MPQSLFVYGTLHPDLALPEMREAVARLVLRGRATIRGTLHDLGEYPGLRLDDASETVHGSVFLLPEDPALLVQLDDYEGYRPHDPAASLFVRVLEEVTLEDGSTLRCWLYLYNQPLP